MKTRIVGLFAAAVLLVCGAGSASADPVTITGGGWIEAANIDGGVLILISDQFNIQGPWNCCGLALGRNVDPGSTVDFSITPVAPPEGATGVVNGVTYNSTTEPLNFTGSSFSFAVSPITLPGPIQGHATIELTTPFTMTGVLRLSTASGTPVFFGDISGAGHLALDFAQSPDGPFTLICGASCGDFRFESSAAPTPEPATLLLLTTGVAIVGSRTYRRRR